MLRTVLLKAITLILVVCPSKEGHCQEFRGYVYNKKTNAPIPYCSITDSKRKIGLTSDENGLFIIDDLKKFDAILTSSIGYKSDTLYLKDKAGATIYLEEKSVQLNEVVVRRAKKVRLGSKNKRSQGSFGGFFNSNYEVAVWIPNEQSSEGLVSDVWFYVVRDGVYNTPFRVRAYKNNNGNVGEEISNENMVFKAHTKGWNKFNVLKYNVVFPEQGFFLVMEWLYTNDERYKYSLLKDAKDQKSGFGQVIGMTTEEAMLTFYFRENQGKWFSGGDIYRPKSANSFELYRLFSPMMRIDVLY